MIIKYISLWLIGVWVLAMLMTIVNKLDPTDPIPNWMQSIVGFIWMMYVIQSHKLEIKK